MKLNNLFIYLFAASFLALTVTSLAAETVNTQSAAQKALSLEERVQDLEAYMNNTQRVKDNAAISTQPRPDKTNVASAGPGHNAWLMTSSILVLFMTLPGLALFYGGLVRAKNVLSVVAQCFAITGIVTVLWWAIGYSLVFSENTPFVGGSAYALFRGVDSSVGQGGPWISNNVFALFQMMFAIITPALIVGAIAERMKFSSVLVFVIFWMFAVYFPLAHMVWGPGGFMNGLGNFDKAAIRSIDFAGGTVVHMSSGWSALILCLIVGKRSGFGTRAFAPHSMVLTAVGTGMLWVGWYGFNAGSALAADGIAANAFVTTTFSAAVAALVWPTLEWTIKGHPTVLGFCSGAIAGLVVITPAAGFVSANSAIAMGLLAGVVPFFTVMYMKRWLGYDDSLDTFGIHGIGGTLGALITPLFGSQEVNPALANVLQLSLFAEHLKAIGLTITLSVVTTAIIAFAIKYTLGLKVKAAHESLGLDISEHGEEGYGGFQTFVE